MRVKEIFTDIYNEIVFCFSLARDVRRCLREESDRERLCLTLA